MFHDNDGKQKWKRTLKRSQEIDRKKAELAQLGQKPFATLD